MEPETTTDVESTTLRLSIDHAILTRVLPCQDSVTLTQKALMSMVLIG